MAQLLATTADAARTLGIGRTKLFELLKLGEIEAVRLGRKTLIRTRELERFASALPSRSRVRRIKVPSGPAMHNLLSDRAHREEHVPQGTLALQHEGSE